MGHGWVGVPPRVMFYPILRFPLVRVVVGGFFATTTLAWNSALVPVDAKGRLSYVADPATGNTIPDFSNAGYRGGGIALPTSVPVVLTLSPGEGDATARIQSALDQVAALPVQPDGYRGALRLNAGTYLVTGTLRLNATGMVLSGAGSGDDATANTILRRTGTSQAAIIQAGARDDQFKGEVSGTRSQITTTRVVVGARSFEVDHPEYYRVGDPIVIYHPSTQAWLDAVDRGGVTDSNYWRPGEIDIRYHRYVTAITGQTLEIDAPVFTNLDRSRSQSVVYRYDHGHVLRRMGVENLQVDIVTKGELTEDHAEDAITFVGAEDSWIRDCTMKHFWHAGVQFEGSTRCTVERCRAIEPHGPIDGGYRYNFSTYHAQLILFRDCFASYARHAYVCNGTSLDSGIVFLNSIIDHAYTSSEGHRRWSTGVLYDNIVATTRQSTDVLGLYNRGTYGTGHGWATAHSVAWNCNAAGGRVWIQQPPTAQNYGIGCSGNVTGTGPFAGSAGFIEGTGQTGLAPVSLYLAQLAQRQADAGPPVITRPPETHTVMAGETVVLTVTATNAVSFQWRHDNAAVAGATADTLVLPTIGGADAGEYTVTVGNAAGTITSDAAKLSLLSSGQPGRLINISIRAVTSTASQTLVVGTTVKNDERQGTLPVLMRVAGPALIPFNVGSVLADPLLTLRTTDAVITSNDDWNDDASVAQLASRLGAFPFPAHTLDAATSWPNLAAGGYTMLVTAADKSAASARSGVVVAEVYDATPSSEFRATGPRLTNVSGRAPSDPATSVLIAGFTIVGDTSKTVLLRGVGPGLTAFSVDGALAFPQLQLFRGATLLERNAGWGGAARIDAASRATGAFSLGPSSKDATLLLTLPPGGYTVHMSGANNAAGVGLVEVYLLTP